MTFARIGRVLKLSKLLRIFRAIKFLAPLRQMLNAIMQSMSMLFWAVGFLLILLWTMSLVLLQGFSEVTPRADVAIADKELIYAMYGTIPKAIYTLFVIFTLGDTGLWANTYHVAWLAGDFYVALLLASLSFFLISLYNILTAIVVEYVVTNAQLDEAERISQYRQKLYEQSQQLKKLFHEIDQDGSGEITEAEIVAAMEDDEVIYNMKECQVNPTDARRFFAVLDSQSKTNAVKIDQFVDGCMQMRGAAAGIDVQILRCQANLISRKLKEQRDELLQVKQLLMEARFGHGNGVTSRPGKDPSIPSMI